MKRFLLFCCRDYYPNGGWLDFKADFDTREEAEARGSQELTENFFDDWHVVDITIGKVVAKG